LNTTENVDIEGVLARSVESYLADPEGESEPQRLREVCSALARFLGLQLQGHESWSQYYWVDDILPTSATASSGELTVCGLMIWGQRKQSKQWIEPFLATLRRSSAGSQTLAYQIVCGDAGRGLGTTSYGTRRRVTEKLPQDWLFSFTDGGTESAG